MDDATRANRQERRARVRTRRPWPMRLLRLVLVTCTLASTVVFAGVVFGNATGHFRLAPVLSGSMSPAIPTGSIVFAEPIPTSDVNVGDVILFNAPTDGNPLTMHRIYEEQEAKGEGTVYITKGDANDAPDAWRIRLRGATAWRVVHHVPKAGTILGWLTGVNMRMIVLVGGVLVFLLAALSVIWGKGPISWKAHDPHGVIRRRQRRMTTRRAFAITTVGVTTVGALALAGLAGAQFTATPTPPAPAVGSASLLPPTNVQATSNASVKLTWTAPASPSADGVRVFRSSASGGPYSQITQIEGLGTTTYTDSPGNGTWYYVLRSKRTTGGANWESANSTQVSFTVGGATFVFKDTTANTGTNCLVGATGSPLTSRDMQQGFTPTGPEASWGGREATMDFCSSTFTTGQSLAAGTTTANLYLTNTRNQDCPVTLTLLRNGTSLGTTVLTVPAQTDSTTLFTSSFSTTSTSFTTGDRLAFRFDQPNTPFCSSTNLYWNSASSASQITVPQLT